MDLKAKIEELNGLVQQGRAMEAFEKFYHPDVVMVEKSDVVGVGKDANRAREEEFFSKVTEFRGAEVKSVAVGDDVTSVEWHYDYTHSDWGVMNYDQVAVQRWQDGLIVHERFYALY
jgi:hypothetical protein